MPAQPVMPRATVASDAVTMMCLMVFMMMIS
jgi:hypothetical protein